MSDEEITSKDLAKIVIGGDLSMLSIEELTRRINLLEQEISRIKTDIKAKELSKEAAESVFRS